MVSGAFRLCANPLGLCASGHMWQHARMAGSENTQLVINERTAVGWPVLVVAGAALLYLGGLSTTVVIQGAQLARQQTAIEALQFQRSEDKTRLETIAVGVARVEKAIDGMPTQIQLLIRAQGQEQYRPASGHAP